MDSYNAIIENANNIGNIKGPIEVNNIDSFNNGESGDSNDNSLDCITQPTNTRCIINPAIPTL